MKKFFKQILLILLTILILPVPYSSTSAAEPDADLWNVIKPLDTTVTFLNVGAHPDDERSDLLAYLSRGLGVKTSSLIANRGEGGQNEIGSELNNALGIIRSKEMIEAAKVTGVKAYHLSQTTSDSIYDFGFSKSIEETLEKWGEDLTYERLIRFIRTYQPDIVMPSFRNVSSQHGHHRTMSMLSEKAFLDAANPEIYPEQLKDGLSVWKVKKLYLPATSSESATTSIEIGDYDPIYQMSYPQLGEQSRYMHKSQGMGNDIPVAPRQSYLELIKTSVDTKNSNDIFAGIPYDLSEWASKLPKQETTLKQKLRKLQGNLDTIIKSYPNRNEVFNQSQKALKDVRELIKKTKKARLTSDLKNDLHHKLTIKEEQLQEASFVSSNLEVNIEIDTDVLTKGETTTVKVNLKNNGKNNLNNIETNLMVPDGWKVKQKSQKIKHKEKSNKTINLKRGQSYKVTYTLTVPKNTDYYHAYHESAIKAGVSYNAYGSKTKQEIEPSSTIAVLPDISLALIPEDIVVNTANPQEEIPVTVKVKNFKNGKTDSIISLNVPNGWDVSPNNKKVKFNQQGEEKEIAFKLMPPATIEEGNFDIEASAKVNGKTYNDTVQEINYDHIGKSYYLYPSVINGNSFELLTDNSLKIGYIESGFDQVADYLTNAGVQISKLSDSDIATGNLNQYDSIVIGIRAYLSRTALIENNERLKEYVANGGHLVVQYHKPSDGWNSETTAPFPLTIGNPSIDWRVTDEKADVDVLDSNSPLFNFPNKITNSDWDNWVQERGLYFPMKWDSQYKTFIKMADPNEAPFDGGILMAQYGKGTYLYTSLVFYRQIQEQVPGAYRIFTNLISYNEN